MEALVDLIKRIGIFMIAAQAVIHFSPEEKYGKYMKLIVSIMILLQFLTPVYHMFAESAPDWSENLTNISTEIPIDEINMGESAADALVASMENEIKSRLNDEITDAEGYRVVNVKVSLHTSREKDENGLKEYELNNVRIVVMAHRMPASEDDSGEKGEGAEAFYGEEDDPANKSEKKSDEDKDEIEKSEIEKIQIGKVIVGTQQIEESAPVLTDAGQRNEEMQKRFAQILGIGEEYVEVSVYGTVEENAE